MGLSSVLSSALSGMRVTQSALDIVARNVANADTPGYTRKSHNQVVSITGDTTSALAKPAQRLIDTILQRQIRDERAVASAAMQAARYHDRLDALFGTPGGENALDTRFNAFINSLQALSTSPDSYAVRAQVLDEATSLATHLNAMSRSIQDLRQDAERGLSGAVDKTNDLLKRLELVNNDIVTRSPSGGINPDLLDERDRLIDQLSQLMDVTVTERGDGTVSVFTKSGALLLDRQASMLVFDARASMGAEALYDKDLEKRGVGTIMLMSPDGHAIDLIRDKAIRSGEIAALVDMRDNVLVEAQSQLDELAAQMALALSTKPIESAALDAGPGVEAGRAIDTSEILPGNQLRLTVNVSGEERLVTVVNSRETSIGDNATADPNDIVIAADLSDPAAAAAEIEAALAARLGPGVTVAADGGILEFRGDGADMRIGALMGSATETSLSGGSVALPMFLDSAGKPFTGSLDGRPQVQGFAGRITLNSALVQDNALLVQYGADIHIGDATRPDAIIDRLTRQSVAFSSGTGIGSQTRPFTGSVQSFTQTVTSHRAREAAQAERVAEGQAIVLGALEEKYLSVSGVNIDEEMANLIQLQNAFAANARVMQSVQDMMDLLLRI